MRISCLIPVLNEPEDQLIQVLDNLTNGYSVDQIEVLLYNDGSCHDDGTPKSLQSYNFPYRIRQYLKIIDCPTRFGVGYAFDRLSEIAKGEILVLMGADIYPEKGWYNKVVQAVKPKELSCACSVGLQPDNHDIDKEGMISRYGARLMLTYTVADLPKNSPLQDNPDYKDIIGARWESKKSDEPYEISCLMGAFYFCEKKFYQEIHGFDTILNKRFHGHSHWGILEAFISIKAKVYGGKCVMYPDIKAGHVFGRLDEENVFKVRALKNDMVYFNKLWVAHTMLDDDFRDEVLAFPSFCKNLSEAQSYIKYNWSAVQNARERNKRYGSLIGKNDI